ncbi:MAG: Cu2+-exporting ATPase [Parcubacteria group bacterium Gr01-1014_18]|nr:MAG: Cu2+-exporting ATPase [Parcubacteria group bacterium Greene0416_36]TSC80289.1 MAG: Cu2+-exporting ATPase [Parcubacteria group bacterium Gr01-1014_18]TSC98268.1 MAG: Cu2+-exporting ATPase [Parcubacteria group bacterium Greene1014_20]TSD06989.1 MAG: Cu2+-exporting ATPase [Parcubacteria group bacterium Greene0714_2]
MSESLKNKSSELRILFLWSAVFTLVIWFLSVSQGNTVLSFGVQLILAGVVQFFFGWILFRNIWDFLRRRRLERDFFASVVIVFIYTYSIFSWFYSRGSVFFHVSSFLITSILFGKWMIAWLESWICLWRMRLESQAPRFARTMRGKEELRLPVEEVRVGDRVWVRSGDRVPMDGKVVGGLALVDESVLGGEDLPIEKKEGDWVYAGTLNAGGSFELTVERLRIDSRLAKILSHADRALGSESLFEAPDKKAVRIFGYSSLILASGIFFFWYEWGLLSAIDSLFIAFSVILVISLDAFRLSYRIPLAIALGRGVRSGIFFRNFADMEYASRVSAVVLDQHSVVMEGQPYLADIWVHSGPKEGLMIRAASIAAATPLYVFSKAIVAKSETMHLSLFRATGVGLDGSGGIKGVVEVRQTKREEEIFVGIPSALIMAKSLSRGIGNDVERIENQGKTVLWVCSSCDVLGFLIIEDHVRPRSLEAVKVFHSLGFNLILFSADNPKSASAVASKLGISEVYSLSAGDEFLDIARKMKDRNIGVALVGDEVSCSTGSNHFTVLLDGGSAFGTDSFSLILGKNDLGDLPKALLLSRAAVAKIKMNFALAIALNLIFIFLAASGTISLILSALFMLMIPFLVFVNSLFFRSKSSMPS